MFPEDGCLTRSRKGPRFTIPVWLRRLATKVPAFIVVALGVDALQGGDINCHTIVFLRNDIYSLLVEATPDRGKETRASLDWSEPELLRDMLKRRLVTMAWIERPRLRNSGG